MPVAPAGADSGVRGLESVVALVAAGPVAAGFWAAVVPEGADDSGVLGLESVVAWVACVELSVFWLLAAGRGLLPALRDGFCAAGFAAGALPSVLPWLLSCLAAALPVLRF